MSDDYLWDKSGKPDPDVVELERALAPLRHREQSLPAATATANASETASPTKLRPSRRLPVRAVVIVAAAALAVAAIVALWPKRMIVTSPPPTAANSAPAVPPDPETPVQLPLPRPDADASWGVTRVAGAPVCDNRSMTRDCRLRVGQWLETDAHARADIAVAEIGRVHVEPGSRLRLTETGPSQHRLELARGKISAQVDAPPRLFQVATPAATAVDLGCAYSLEVGDSGDGVLAVTSGYVSLEWNKRTSLVPAGARCEMKHDLGPGIPTFDDAKGPLKAAIHDFDFASGGERAVVVALSEARPRDSLTLWHLLFRVDADVRPLVYERLQKLVAPPPEMTREDALELRRDRLQGWKDRMRRTW